MNRNTAMSIVGYVSIGAIVAICITLVVMLSFDKTSADPLTLEPQTTPEKTSQPTDFIGVLPGKDADAADCLIVHYIDMVDPEKGEEAGRRYLLQNVCDHGVNVAWFDGGECEAMCNLLLAGEKYELIEAMGGNMYIAACKPPAMVTDFGLWGSSSYRCVEKGKE